jgi:hypothetical protein
VRPALKSGLAAVWRDRDTLQIGIDPRRAVALTGMANAAPVIGLLDGSRDRSQLLAAATESGVPAPAVERILDLLAAAGVLDDFPLNTLRILPQPLRTSLAPELATASLAYRDSDAGARSLARRRAACIRVHGPGRIATVLTGLLDAAGVGVVLRADDDDGSGSAGEQNRRRAGQHARRAVTRPDVEVLTSRPGPGVLSRLVGQGIPHLAVSGSEAIGIVGPLVLPGRSACLRCLDLTRSDRDPAWPRILAQLARREASPAACDVTLAAAVAAQAATQVLGFVDVHDAAAIGCTLELVLPGWQWRRRTWPPHPRCSCGSHNGWERQPAGSSGRAQLDGAG